MIDPNTPTPQRQDNIFIQPLPINNITPLTHLIQNYLSMNKEGANVRYKLREFQWFEMETKVRQIIQELLAPFSKRVFETMSNISSLKAFTMEESYKLEELRKVVTDDPNSKEIDIFKSIDKKQEKMEMQIAEMRNLVGETQKVIDNRFKLQDERLEESKEIILNNMKLKERISEEIIQQNNNLKEFREETTKVLDDFSKTLNGVIRDHEEDMKVVKDSISKLDDRIERLEQFKKETTVKFQLNKEEHGSFNKQIIRNHEDIQLINKEIASLNQNLSYTKKLTNYVKDLQERINKEDFKIQHLSPLVTQAQITETLYNILPAKMRKRLIIYDYYKYGKMNANILEVDIKKQHIEPFNGVGILELVQKRTTKIIIDMKRKKLVEEGVDIDNLTYEMKQKCYKEVNLAGDYQDDEEETKPTPGIDKDQISEMIQQMLNLTQKQLTRQITTQFTDCRKYIESLEQQLQHNLTMTNNLIDKVKSENQSFRLEQELHNQYLQEKVESNVESHFANSKELSGVKESLITFIKFCSLVNHLQIQDQLDKQSISLFGVKETFMDQPHPESNGDGQEYRSSSKVIDIKKECFSCCGFPASTMAAFKMACLTYNPSSIVLESRQYRREEILEMSTRLLHHLKGQIVQPSQSQSQSQDRTLYSSIPYTGHRKNIMTFTQQSQLNNVFHNDGEQGSKTNKKELKLERFQKNPEERLGKSRRINTAKTNYRTSTRISSSLKSTHRKNDNTSLVSTIFTEQQKKHAFYLS